METTTCFRIFRLPTAHLAKHLFRSQQPVDSFVNEAASSQSSIFTRSNNTTPDEFGFDQSTRHFIESSKLTEALDVMSSYVPPPYPPSNTPAYDVNQLNRIEQSINSFWLVSENRLSIVQQELHAIACQVGSVQHIQEEANARVSDVVALQVEITQRQ